MAESKVTETALYLTFKLDEEIFALDVRQVREILDLTDITRVPHTPDYMKGVINVRGSVVPVVDLRSRFSLSETDSTVDTRIIVMEVSIGDKPITLGAIADSVHDVIELEPDQIDAAPKLGTRWRTEFIRGIGKYNEVFMIIIDINRLFSMDELTAVDNRCGTHIDMGMTELAA